MYRKQQGFLLPVALFIIVGLAVLAGSMSALTTQTGSASLREGISLQAFYAADSAVQRAMHLIFASDANRATATTNCAAVDGSSLTLMATGLNGCQTSTNCSSAINSSNTTSFFTVTSTASCGAGDLSAQRTIQASAYLND